MKLMEGMTNGQVAKALGLQRSTVNHYWGSVYRKTGIGSRPALIQWVRQRSTEAPRSFKRWEPTFSHHRPNDLGLPRNPKNPCH